MIPSIFPTVIPGQQLSAELLNQVTSLLQQLSGMIDGGDVQQFSGVGIAGGRLVDLKKSMVAKVIDIIPGGESEGDEPFLRYVIREQIFTEAGGFTDADFPTESEYAYESGGNVDIKKETIVLAFPSFLRLGEYQEYVFFCGCDQGPYRCNPQGNVDFVSDVSLIPENHTTVTTAATSLTLGLNNRNVLISGAASDVTVTMPLAADAFDHVNGIGYEYIVKRADSLGHNVTVTPNVADTMESDSGSSQVLADDADFVKLVSDGVSKWREI